MTIMVGLPPPSNSPIVKLLLDFVDGINRATNHFGNVGDGVFFVQEIGDLPGLGLSKKPISGFCGSDFPSTIPAFNLCYFYA